MGSPNRTKRRYLLLSVGLGTAIAAAKFTAYWLTGSAAILTDAAESLVNVVAASFALYAVWLSSRPPDAAHPYGHGKIEFVSAGFEGAFIGFAGLGILYEAYRAIAHPTAPAALGIGVWLVTAGMVGNGFLGWLLLRGGKRHHSIALVADGKHLLSDALTSLGLLAGLGLMHLTKLYWLDGVIALLLAAMLLYHGGLLIRDSLRGLMDEQDTHLLAEVAALLQAHRQPGWVDLHNLRVMRNGPDIHLDAHVVLPWYEDLRQVNTRLEAIHAVLDAHFRNRVEVFLHAEPCRPVSCPSCDLQGCQHRQAPFQQTMPWTAQRIINHETNQLGPNP